MAIFYCSLKRPKKRAQACKILKVEYNSVHGFYIEISRAQAENAPAEYRRRQTLKNAERFITPELKAFEDKVLSANERALAREKILYAQILFDLEPFITALQTNSGAVASLDVLCCFAERAQALKLCTAAICQQEAGIAIEDGRHAVVESITQPFVANDVALKSISSIIADYWPEYGRKIHLYAANCVDCVVGTLWCLCASKCR